jgi:hypothetical protein
VQREQARKELQSIGMPALESLRRAVKTADAESARRLRELIRELEEQLLAQQILAPKEIQLVLKDATVQEAIAELAKISGYPIQFMGDATVFADKKLTLDTGKTTFWQAFDQLCTKAGLVERVDLSVAASQIYYPRVAKNGLRRPLYVPQQEGTQNGPITVTPRGAEKSVVTFAGSLKTELRISRDEKKKEFDLMFIVSSEPRHHNSGVVGKPIFDKILDSQGRKLKEAVEPAKKEAEDLTDPEASDILPPLRRFTNIRLKDDGEPAKAIKELVGKLTYQVDLQNEVLARMDKVLGAAGKSVPTSNGGTLKVLGVRKQDADFFVDVSIENANAVIQGGGAIVIRGNVAIRGGIVVGPGGVRMNGDGTNKDLPDLLDAKGQKFKVVAVTGDSFNFVNGLTTRTATIQFQPNPDQGEPRDLILYGTRTHAIAVPFRFENVPLP